MRTGAIIPIDDRGLLEWIIMRTLEKQGRRRQGGCKEKEWLGFVSDNLRKVGVRDG